MILINSFLAVFCAHLSRNAFEDGLNTSGWLSLVASAGNTAVVMAAIL
jgi:hypothetical protein